MIAGRDFRHYAAEFFMLRDLRGHFAGEQLRAALAVSAAQDRHRGLEEHVQADAWHAVAPAVVMAALAPAGAP